jgi:hypothetical protein
MKAKLIPVALLLLALGFLGCSSTNDRGVTVKKPFDFFSADTVRPLPGTPAPSFAPATHS